MILKGRWGVALAGRCMTATVARLIESETSRGVIIQSAKLSICELMAVYF